MTATVIGFLANVEVFRDLPPEGLNRLLEWGVARRFPVGVALMRQGEPSDALHVILRGRVRVERLQASHDQPFVLAELGPGEIVGEMGVLDDAPRSATVIAIEDTATLEFGALVLAETVLLYPQVSRALLHTLSQRLRTTNDLIDHLMRMQRSEAPV